MVRESADIRQPPRRMRLRFYAVLVGRLTIFSWGKLPRENSWRSLVSIESLEDIIGQTRRGALLFISAEPPRTTAGWILHFDQLWWIKMKRDNRGNMIPMVGKWSQPPLSCLACRQKKRRCDRKKPCSNCVQRHISCEYSGGAVPTAAVDSDISHRSTYHANNNAKERAAQSAIASQ